MNKYDKYTNYTKEELIDELESLKKKKYGLVWDRKNSQEIIDAFVNWENVPEKLIPNKFPVLKELPNKELFTDKSNPINLLLEGDNYHSLAVLNFTHKNKIDAIYIDPPYNTGNEEFIYNDKMVDLEDPWRHSKWLSFMEKRLYSAKNLLRESGLIFISIDDNEHAQLKLLCDEIFGEKNFIADIIWQKAYSPVNLRKTFSANHDFILCYAKNYLYSEIKQLPRTEESIKRYKNPDNDPRGDWKSTDLSVGPAVQENIYEIISPSGRKILPPKGRSWVLNKKRFKEFLEDNRIWFGINGNSVPSLKKFLSEVKKGMTPLTIWPYQEVGHNQDAKKEIKEILQSELPFSTPKPLKLIKRILQLSTNKTSTILDFFAGSGTVGHAALVLNNEDSGSRKFILCTNNENNICTDVCYARLEKVIKGYNNTKNEVINGLGGNLKYLKTHFVGAQPTDKNKRELVNNSAEMICLKEDIFELVEEINLDFKIYKNKNKYLGIVFNEEAIEEFKQATSKYKGQFIIYCFSYTGVSPEKEFADMNNKHRIEPIPEVILKVYREIFKK